VRILIFAALAACTSGKDTADDSAGGDTVFEDLSDGLAADPECDDVLDSKVAGATSFFYGDFRFDGSSVSGEEQWLLFANETWRDVGGADCTVTWSISGDKGDPGGSCGSCDYGLEIVASVDHSLTDCPDDLFAGVEQFSTTYSVKLSGDDATFYFPSGDVLGTGQAAAGGATYLSTSTCVYF